MTKKLDLKKLNSRNFKVFALALAAVAVAFYAFGRPSDAKAHCDSYQGPVVLSAQHALEAGDVNLILPYVQPEDEAQLTAAFNQALQVRALGPEAQALADEYFYEVTVRLHRQGEGAAYTGLKDEAVPPAIAAADEAMLNGELEGVHEMLAEGLEHGLEEKYEAVLHAREVAAEEGTVEANRERVEAELMFEKYVYETYNMVTTGAPGGEGTEGGHNH